MDLTLMEETEELVLATRKDPGVRRLRAFRESDSVAILATSS